MEGSQVALLASGIAVVGTILYFLWRRIEESSRWKEVAVVGKLFIHPVKSCRGIEVDSFKAGFRGVTARKTAIGDRSFMMVYEYGKFATIRQFPRMVLISPKIIDNDTLQLEAPGMDPLRVQIPKYGSGTVLSYRVWESRCAATDCGDDAGAWLEKFLGASNARLVFHNQRLPVNERKKLLEFGHLGVYAEEPVKSMFQDYSPFNILSQGSIDFLNTKLPSDHQVYERFFRPNVFLKGCDAFAEDTWKRIKIGAAEFRFAQNATRCHVTTVNPDTGIKDQELNTLVALSSFRLCSPEEKVLYGTAPKFSVDFIVVKEGQINVGDKVYVAVEDKND